jgi:Transposase DDE domain
VRVHVVITEEGLPVEFAILPGRVSELRAFDALSLALPSGAELYADAAFTCYWIEDTLRELDSIDRQVCYRRNSKRRAQPQIEAFKKLMRRIIESAFSSLSVHFGHHIHAVTFRGFQLKLCLLLLGFTLNKAFCS